MIREAIAQLLEKESLTSDQAEGVMDEVMTGAATPARIGAFLVALRMKGETVEEITGCATAMRRAALHVCPDSVDMIDTCGTGGDRAGTFNISTTAAFVVAGAGLPVAKHGNRSVSSQSGSADVLEALGVNLNLTAEAIAQCIDEVGIGFLYAPRLHPAMRYAIGPRKELGVRTIFNILGPLTNPAGAASQLLGVYSPELTEVMARVLQSLGSRAACVVHGYHGVDELTTTGPNQISTFGLDGQNGDVKTVGLDPQALGFARAKRIDLLGGTPVENAIISRDILAGKDRGPRRDVVLLNSGMVLYVGGKTDSLEDGLVSAAESIDQGAAQEKLVALAELSQALAGVQA
ncbi:MAG: anthranilate phosphoribosyltransferase [Anaerolineales bacterium]|nr:MAG: anthranilate phosphoribosyltransferase [Anaerolineales bacterium]